MYFVPCGAYNSRNTKPFLLERGPFLAPGPAPGPTPGQLGRKPRAGPRAQGRWESGAGESALELGSCVRTGGGLSNTRFFQRRRDC